MVTASMGAAQVTKDAAAAHVVLVTSEFGFLDWLGAGAIQTGFLLSHVQVKLRVPASFTPDRDV